ncbi:hypothetical protein Ancab_008425 [Ancistrocladus abbreviatus]
MEVSSFKNHTKAVTFNPCSSAAVVANDAFVFSAANISTTAEEYRSGLRVPVVLNRTIAHRSCHAAETDQTVLCKENSDCTDPPGEIGYRCQCWTSILAAKTLMNVASQNSIIAKSQRLVKTIMEDTNVNAP